MKLKTIIMLSLFILMTEYPARAETLNDVIIISPTDTKHTFYRGRQGHFGANRGNGKKHAGVDIITNIAVHDKEKYSVKAVNSGIVAYTRINGSASTDFGYTVVIDHGNGYYTQYSHLATKASAGIVKLKDAVLLPGQIIGYMADLSKDSRSSGNVWSEVVKPYDRIQLHFEVFTAPPGRTSNTTLAELKLTSNRVNPTTVLMKLGYRKIN